MSTSSAEDAHMYDSSTVDDEEQQQHEEEEEEEESSEANNSAAANDDDHAGEDGSGAALAVMQQTAARKARKAKHVKHQRLVWSKALSLRIKQQGAVTLANRLPQPTVLRELARQRADVRHSMARAAQSAARLTLTLVRMQRAVARSSGESLEFGTKVPAASASPKRMPKWESVVAPMHQCLDPWVDATFEKWEQRVEASTNQRQRSKLKSINKRIREQVDATLEDRERLVRRTRRKRTLGRVVGDPAPTGSASVAASDSRQEPLRPHVYDDTDFYQVLLKDFLAASMATMGGAVIHRNLNPGTRGKVVDRRASKGRKVRYTVHDPLVNFMAPTEYPDLPEGAERLFASLFQA